VEELLVHQAIRIAGKENLAATLIELLGNLPAAEATGSRAREVFERQAGATERCVKAIRNLLKIEAAAEYPK